MAAPLLISLSNVYNFRNPCCSHGKTKEDTARFRLVFSFFSLLFVRVSRLVYSMKTHSSTLELCQKTRSHWRAFCCYCVVFGWLGIFAHRLIPQWPIIFEMPARECARRRDAGSTRSGFEIVGDSLEDVVHYSPRTTIHLFSRTKCMLKELQYTFSVTPFLIFHSSFSIHLYIIFPPKNQHPSASLPLPSWFLCLGLVPECLGWPDD